MYHTLGQRKGLGIGGTKDGSEDPWYVVDKDVENNVLIVAQGHEHPRLMSVGLIAQQLHWVEREPFTGTLRCTVKPATARPIFRARLTRWMTIVSRSFLTSRLPLLRRASPPSFTAAKSAWAAVLSSSGCR